MTRRNPYLWPQGMVLIIRDRFGEICRSTDRRFDLADAIMLGTPTKQKTVTLTFQLTNSQSDDLTSQLEKLIRYDLEFDGYQVKLTQQEPCDPLLDYEWKLVVRGP